MQRYPTPPPITPAGRPNDWESWGDRVPLCVDLDQSLLATDSTWEALIALVKKRPAILLKLLLWLARGRACLKREVAQLSPLDPEMLPFNPEVLDFLEHAHRNGRRLILATGADRKIAERVAAQLGFFSLVLASDGGLNLTGNNKLATIRAHLHGQPFDYLGDSYSDLKIWHHARRALLVNPSPWTLFRARRIARVERVFGKPNENASGKLLLRELRPHQWVKNLLLFVPLILAHEVLNPVAAARVLGGFVCFSLCASAVYVVNDLVDLASDRAHPEKSRRPLASGQLRVSIAALSVPVLLTLGLVVATVLLSGGFGLILTAYVTLAFAYSVFFKRLAIVDVFVLAALYTIRILAGAVVAGVPVSRWLGAFSVFFFLSLAFVKRYAELRAIAVREGERAAGRGYLIDDTGFLQTAGIGGGYVAALVLALYVNSPEVSHLYRSPGWLWLICPLVLYWITRLWFIAQRGGMNEDPILFALHDKVSYLTAVVSALVIMLAL